eukprot:jgi/Bigna1/73330/fgenesh1_pg.23_\
MELGSSFRRRDKASRDDASSDKGKPENKAGGAAATNLFRIAEKRYRLYKVNDTASPPSSAPRKKDDAQQVWRIPEVEGLYIIKNALSLQEQLFWAKRAIKEFSNCAHTNLSNLHGTQPDHWANAVECNDVGKDSEFYKLRWASLGYHYDWTQRLYHKYQHQNEKSDFPENLASMADALARRVGLKVKSEAAIVNFYPYDGSMGGGKSKDVEPTAIFVNSGDAVIMGGHSRLCFHGVPRILEGSCEELARFLHDSPSKEEKLIGKYLTRSRINMNVRQVTQLAKQTGIRGIC